jgi:hypothetical protein
MSAVVRADERAMLGESLRRLLAETDRAKVPAALDDFGWADLLAASPVEAVIALFGIQGETLTATPALNAVMAQPLLAAVGRSGAGTGEWTVPLPAPGPAAHPEAVYAVTAGAPLGRCLVVRTSGDGPVLTESDGPADQVAVEGIDPDLGLVRMEFGAGEVLARGDGVGAAWDAALAAGRLALACELAGVCRTMLGLGVVHVTERRQFGQPIGRFQAVKHRLADAKVALIAAEAAIDEAAAEPGPLTAMLAKVWAGRATRVTAKQVQQVLGGMGFTWEHPFHRHVRRALALEGLAGSAAELQHDLGRRLLSTADVPQMAGL